MLRHDYVISVVFNRHDMAREVAISSSFNNKIYLEMPVFEYLSMLVLREILQTPCEVERTIDIVVFLPMFSRL